MAIVYDTRNGSDTHEPLLRVRDLCVDFPLEGGEVRHAVNDVSFDVSHGSVTCLVGESGSGKSVTAMSTIDLVDEPGRIVGGTITFMVTTCYRSTIRILSGCVVKESP